MPPLISQYLETALLKKWIRIPESLIHSLRPAIPKFYPQNQKDLSTTSWHTWKKYCATVLRVRGDHTQYKNPSASKNIAFLPCINIQIEARDDQEVKCGGFQCGVPQFPRHL